MEKLNLAAKGKKKMKQEQSSSDSEADAKRPQDDSSSDSEADEVAPLEVSKNLQMAKKSRTSVSAEVFGKYHVKAAFKPKIIQKSQAVQESIKNRMLGAFMFMNLDDKDMQVVIDAMD